MHFWKSSLSKIVCSAFLLFFCSLSNSFADRVSETPDFLQKNPVLTKNGSQYCAPIAVSNSFMWLADRGFSNLSSPAGNHYERQLKLVQELASPAFFNTDKNNGSSNAEVLRGIRAFVQSKGYQIDLLKYWGRRRYPKDIDFGADTFDLVTLASEFDGTTVGWVHIGRYQSLGHSQWRRTGSHWVTLVDIDASGEELKVIDPAPISGSERRVQTLSLIKMGDEKFIPKNNRRPQSLAGLYQVRNGLAFDKKKADVPIVDGVILLRLRS